MEAASASKMLVRMYPVAQYCIAEDCITVLNICTVFNFEADKP